MVSETKTKVIPTANQEKGKNLQEPMRTKRKITKLPKARENAGDQVVISVSFASDWLRKWRKFSRPITEQSKAKSRITFGTQ